MPYRDQEIEYLGWYRNNILGIEEPGTYNYRGNILNKEHILPTGANKKRLNILEPYRNAFYNSPASNISFHRYFHHLNSSQALCINLFFPIMYEACSNVLLDCFRVPELVGEYAFEKESPLEITEGNRRKTNFDLYIQTQQQKEFFFEIKYTEEGFGKVEADETHVAKYEFTYEQLLEDSQYIQPEFKNMESFLNYYQILRNLIHTGPNSTVIFLYPENNNRVNSQALFAYENILTELGRGAFHIIYLEDVVPCIQSKITNPLLIEHYNQFVAKYIHDAV